MTILVHHPGSPRQHVLCETHADMRDLRSLTDAGSQQSILDIGVVANLGTPVYIGECPCAPDEVNERATGVAAAADTAVSGRSEHRSPIWHVAPGTENESPCAPDEVNEADARAIRESPYSSYDLAPTFGVSISTIRQIRSGPSAPDEVNGRGTT